MADEKFGSMKDYMTDEQVQREAAQLRAALESYTHRDRDLRIYHEAHATFASNVPEGRLYGDSDELVLQVIEEVTGNYSVVLGNGFHTFYLSSAEGRGIRVLFSTPEEIVTEFPGLTWEANK